MSTPMYEMPEHFPMPVDKNGNGPAEGDEIVRIACWCGIPECLEFRQASDR